MLNCQTPQSVCYILHNISITAANRTTCTSHISLDTLTLTSATFLTGTVNQFTADCGHRK